MNRLRIAILLLLFGLQVAAATPAVTIRLNSTRAEVVAALGEPPGTLKQGQTTVLVYPAGDIKLQNDRVIAVAEAYQAAEEEVVETITTATVTAPVLAPEPLVLTNSTHPTALASTNGVLGLLRGMRSGTNTTAGTKSAPSMPLVIFAFALMGIGGLMAAGGNIWLLVKAFTQSIGWGLACLFLPFAILVFLIMYWKLVWRPFALSLAGSAVAAGGVLVLFFSAAV